MLEQVDISDFDKLEGIIKRNIAACNAQDRTQFEYVKATATLFATQNNVGIWTDSINDPHCLLITTSGKFGVMNEVFTFINTIYIDSSQRNMDLFKKMVSTAEMWARAKGCQILQGSSWLYKGCEDMGDLWEALGFKEQETIYVKHL